MGLKIRTEIDFDPHAFLEGLGGIDNIISMEGGQYPRIRFTLKGKNIISLSTLKRWGVIAVKEVSDGIHVIMPNGALIYQELLKVFE